MTKSLIIINEPFSEMLVGRNTSLAYTLSCAEAGFEVFIFDLSQSLKNFNNSVKTLEVFHLKNSDALILTQKFRQENLKIRTLQESKKFDQLANLENVKVSDVLNQNFSNNFTLQISDVDFVVQRLEPMKSPFPPKGNTKVKDVMQQLRDLFPNKTFNCPITDDFLELEDKETPQEINKICRQEIATPTSEFTLAELTLGEYKTIEAINFAAAKYHEIFGKKNAAKIVIKPKNSAQSLGVFAIQFDELGFDLETLKSKKISQLRDIQIYKIRRQNLHEIITTLCFVQRVFDDKNYEEKLLGDIAENEIYLKARELYNQEILAQPFLEGISNGDIRANILKDADQNFYCAGYTFRSSNRQIIEDQFTTCYTAGKAVSKSISQLSEDEKNSLIEQCEIVVKILNHQLREKYKNVVELGADFILVGDKKSVMLGEINHHCPALIPISEAMSEQNYDGGIAFTKKAIKDWKRD